MLSIDDFKDENGNVNWNVFEEAQIQAGEKCYKCKTHLFHNKTALPTLCFECKSLQEKEEFSHSKYIRCPDCGEHWDPYFKEDYDVLEDGVHSVCCEYCGADFEVNTYVSYTFISPELNKKRNKL